MKKVLALILTIMMLCSLVAACGGSSEPAEAPSTVNDEEYIDDEEDAGGTATGMSAEEYDAEMGEFIPGFELLCDGIGELIAQSESLSSEEDTVAWCQAFIAAKNGIGTAADKLAEVTAQVPEEYQESHIKITIAVAAVYDAMTGFESAVDAVINGDAAAFEDGLAEFLGNAMAADALWQEAVEYR